ncbi:MAG: hypothetical protein ABI433_09710 [Burkholderiaceae bacterium]
MEAKHGVAAAPAHSAGMHRRGGLPATMESTLRRLCRDRVLINGGGARGRGEVFSLPGPRHAVPPLPPLPPHAHWIVRILILLLVVSHGLLAGCGGGGSDDNGSGPAATAIVVQPTDQAVQAGQTASFTVEASGASLSYRWQRSTDAGNSWADVSGATSASYSLATSDSSLNGHQFRVVVAGSAGSVTSSAVTLTVAPLPEPPVIVAEPADVTIGAGSTASFAVTATGTALQYAWQRSTNAGAAWSDLAGATSASLTLNAVSLTDSGMLLRVRVGNALGSVTSRPAALTVTVVAAAPSISSQPVSVTVVAPQSASFQVTAAGTPTPTFQWQRSLDTGVSFADITGATDTSYTTPASSVGDSGQMFRVSISNSAGTVQSDPATLTVSAAAVAAVFTMQPGDQSVVPTAIASFSVAATGTPTPTYQWQVSTDGGLSFFNINGATAATFATPATVLADNGKRYRALASNSESTAFSDAVTLTVASIARVPLSITASPGPVAPGQPVTFTVTELNTAAITVPNHHLLVTVPAFTTVSAAGGAAACSSGVFPCLPGQQVSWVVQTTPGRVTLRQFTAVVSSAAPPPDGTLLTATATASATGAGAGTASTSVVASGAAGLRLALDADATVLAAGGTLIYSLSFTNASTAAIGGSLWLPLPSGTRFVAASDGGALSGGVVRWPLGTVPAGGAGKRQLTVQVNDPLTASPLIVARAEVREPLTLASLARAEHSAAVAGNSLALSVTATPGPVTAGQPVTFTVTELNGAASALPNHNLYVTVPAFTTVSAASSEGQCSSGVFPCLPGQRVSWVVSTAAGKTSVRQFTAVVQAAGAPAAGSLLSVTALAEAAVAGNAHTSTSFATSAAAGMQLAVEADSGKASAGSTLSYRLTFANAAANATTARLLLPLPRGVGFVSASDGGSVGDGVVAWPLGQIAPGASGQRHVTVQLPLNFSGPSLLVAQAELRDPVTAQGLAQAHHVATLSGNGVQLALSAKPKIAQPRQPLMFSITELNATASTVPNHALFVTVPAFMTVDAAAAGGGLCSTGTWPCRASERLSWVINTVAGRSVTRRFTAVIGSADAPRDGSVVEASVMSDLTGITSASTSVVVSSVAGLSLGIDADSPTATAGGTLGYTLTFANASGSMLDAELSLPLPSGVEFVSAGEGGTASGGVVRWPLLAVGAGGSGQRQLTVRIGNSLAGPPLLQADAVLRDPLSARTLAGASHVATLSADLVRLAVTASPPPGVASSTLTFTVTEINGAANLVANHHVFLTVPAYAAVSSGAGADVCSSGVWPCLPGQQVRWTFNTAAGASTSRQVAMQVSGAAVPGTLLTAAAHAELSGIGSDAFDVVVQP